MDPSINSLIPIDHGLDKIKASRQDTTRDSSGDVFDSRPAALSDPSNKRKTQDWIFPSFAAPLSASPDLSIPSPGRPQPCTPPHYAPLATYLTSPTSSMHAPVVHRVSVADSLIDLDMSMPSPPHSGSPSRPSTASSWSEEMGTPAHAQLAGDHFGLERQVALGEAFEAFAEVDGSAGGERGGSAGEEDGRGGWMEGQEAESRDGLVGSGALGKGGQMGLRQLPELPAPPSRRAMDGTGGDGEVVGEMVRLLGG